MSPAGAQAPPPAPAVDARPEAEASTLIGVRDARAASAMVDAALLTGATYVASALQFVAGLLQKAILGPVAAGQWALMQSLWTFMGLSSLGAQHGSTRQVPMERGREDFRAAVAAANVGATFALAAMCALGLVMAVVAVAFGGGWNEELRFGIVLLGVTAPLRLLTDTHEMLIQAVKRFDVQSATVILKAFCALTLQTLAVLAFGFYGMFLGVVAVELAGLFFWYRIGIVTRRRPVFRPQFDRARLRGLISFGGPIMIMAQVWLLYQAVDSLIVAGALSFEELGYYALAGSVTTYVLFLPKSVGSAVFPRMAERFGRSGDITDIHHYATDVQRLLAYVLVPVATGGAFFAFPVLIRHALPAFEPAIEVVQVLVAASFFMALQNMPIKVLLTAGYRWSITAIALGCTAVNAGLNVLFVIVLDEGLVGAATATALSYVFTFLVITSFALSRAIPWRRVVLHVGEILVVFAYCYAALRGLREVFGPGGDGLVADAALAAAQLAIFAVAMLPWLWVAEKRVAGFTLMRDLVRRALEARRR